MGIVYADCVFPSKPLEFHSASTIQQQPNINRSQAVRTNEPKRTRLFVLAVLVVVTTCQSPLKSRGFTPSVRLWAAVPLVAQRIMLGDQNQLSLNKY